MDPFADFDPLSCINRQKAVGAVILLAKISLSSHQNLKDYSTLHEGILSYGSAFLEDQLPILDHRGFSYQRPTGFFEAGRGETCAFAVVRFKLVIEA